MLVICSLIQYLVHNEAKNILGRTFLWKKLLQKAFFNGALKEIHQTWSVHLNCTVLFAQYRTVFLNIQSRRKLNDRANRQKRKSIYMYVSISFSYLALFVSITPAGINCYRLELLQRQCVSTVSCWANRLKD